MLEKLMIRERPSEEQPTMNHHAPPSHNAQAGLTTMQGRLSATKNADFSIFRLALDLSCHLQWVRSPGVSIQSGEILCRSCVPMT